MLIMLLVIGSWAWWHNQQIPTFQEQKNSSAEQNLDYFVEDFSVTTMTPKGKPARTLTANRMEHFRDTDITELEQPFFRIYNESSITWEIASERGTLSPDGETLFLAGQVEIDRPESADARAMHISTSNLRILADQDYAETDEAVKITSDTGWVQGVGMQAWLRKPSHIKFLSQTKSYYDARQHDAQ